MSQLGRFTTGGYSADGWDNFRLVPGIDPLQHHSAQPPVTQQTGVGPGVTAAWAFQQRTGYNVILVPCAWEGTSIHQWAPANMSAPSNQFNSSLFADCVVRGNFVQSMPNITWAVDVPVVLYWDQGESDVGTDNTTQHTALLMKLASAFRSNIANAAQAPFIVTQLNYWWIDNEAGQVNATMIQQSLNNVPFNISYSATVYAMDSHGVPLIGGSGGGVHYDAISQRYLGLVGDLALQSALTNIPGATIPATVYQTFVSYDPLISATTVNISWTPVPVALQYLVNVSGTVSTVASTSTVFGPLAACTVYVVSVAGVGPNSVIGSFSPTNTFSTPCSDSSFWFPLTSNYSDVLNDAVTAAPLGIPVQYMCSPTFASGTAPSGVPSTYLHFPCSSIFGQLAGAGAHYQGGGVGTNVYATASFTASVWIRPTPNFVLYYVLGNAAYVTAGGVFIYLSQTTNSTALLRATMNNGIVYSSSSFPLTNPPVWTMLTLTHDSTSGQAVMYVNGSVAGSPFRTQSTGWVNVTAFQPWTVGGNNPALNHSFVGDMFNARFYNTAQPALTIQSWYAQDSTASSTRVG